MECGHTFAEEGLLDKLSETLRLQEFKTVDKLPAFVAELPKNSKNLVRDLEKRDAEIVRAINFLLSDKPAIEAHTADDTLKENESGSVHTNLGATGAITLTLPSSASKGIHFYFAVQAAQELRIDPGTATIRDTSGQTVDKYKTADAIGECIHIVADANGDWETISKYGTWIEEA